MASQQLERLKGDVIDLEDELRENIARQPQLYNDCTAKAHAVQESADSFHLASRAHKEALERLRSVEACERSARKALQEAEQHHRVKQTAKDQADESLKSNEATAALIRKAIAKKKLEIDRASEANRVPQRLATSQVEAESPDGPPRKRSKLEATKIPLKSWTTGKIFCPSANRFVSGFPHAVEASRTQRFIVHLDTGNTSRTCISRSAFDYLGLRDTATHHGRQSIRGVNGYCSHHDVYEIKYCLDAVNRLKPDTIFQRTVHALVVDDREGPGEYGHYDLLLNAEDSRKLSEKSVDGKSMQFEILDGPEQTLYDRIPLNLQSPYRAKTESSQPSQSSVGGIGGKGAKGDASLGKGYGKQFPDFFGGLDPFEAFFGAPAPRGSSGSGIRVTSALPLIACT